MMLKFVSSLQRKNRAEMGTKIQKQGKVCRNGNDI